MEDPVYTLPFIRNIIDERKQDIVGLATARGDRMTIGKKRSKTAYLLSLFLIMGAPAFIGYALKTVFFRIQKMVSGWLPFIPSPSVAVYARKKNIPVFTNVRPNSQTFRDELKRLKPDVIVHQSQSILKKELLSIPSIGVINRHNALLPKNRGRLTPFWVLYRGEKETGVSIHFVDEGIDSGGILVQEHFKVGAGESFQSLVRKNYHTASIAMRKALDLLEKGQYTVLPNNDNEATYNPVPSLRDAWNYRLKRMFGNNERRPA